MKHTLIDSTTVGQELDLRQKLFETKIKVEEKHVAKYNNQGLWTHTSCENNNSHFLRNNLDIYSQNITFDAN